MATILCVDDDPAALEAVKQALTGAYEVVTSDQPERALELAKRTSFEVACVPSKLKAMSGAALLEKLNAIDPRTERILLTGANSLFAMKQTPGSSEICYVFRPFKPESLREVVAQLVKVAESKRR